MGHRLVQRSIESLRAEAYEDLKAFERYDPTPEEKAKGRWAVVFEALLDGEPDEESIVHIIPIFGALHYITDRCWCCPTVDEDGTVCHKASQ